MKKQKKKYGVLQRIQRVFKLNFYRLFRSPGGAKKVALGFALGFALEMLVLSTASLIYFLFYPIIRLSGGSLPAAIIGNVIGKLTFLPVVLLPFAHALGKLIYPFKIKEAPIKEHSFLEIFSGNFMEVLKDLLHNGLYTLIGMTIFGAFLGFVSYFIIYHLYERERHRRLERRKRHTKVALMRT
ncbi:DUF2062 domain-containing protein [Ectobacillus panaciterrae]|uniref:DUF2062 domain-containing protein n=1 Tax=Ectobacillus panaciterrae TaxID=363872 RepID=UPI000491F894|nr:DUF2062 domain-containing protein [Ectobacillus panaciterrae]